MERLRGVVESVTGLADEIVIGVDARAPPAVAELARALADTVYVFEDGADLSLARDAVFAHATGEWVFFIDDDERLEPGFAERLPALMATPGLTHAWFPRKHVIAEGPPVAVRLDNPWYPDWQLRLFRNDPALAWKPRRLHSGYHVLGQGTFQPSSCILHFTEVWTDPAERQVTLAAYDALEAGLPPAPPGPLLWGVEVLEVDVPAKAHPGEVLVATVRARNTGRLAWVPAWTAGRGALIQLGHHIRDADGEMLRYDCERTSVLAVTRPGDEATFLHLFAAPETPGDYQLEWDLVSERECWFVESQPGTLHRTALSVAG